MWLLEVSMSSIAHLFVAGGFVMYPLVIFLLFALMIGIERIVLYRKFSKDLRRFKNATQKSLALYLLALCAVQRTIMV